MIMSNVMKSESDRLSVADMKLLGEIFIKSGLFGDQLSEAQAVVKIMAGREIGLEPFAAMQGIDIISGKVVMKPIVMAARIKASGKYDYRILTETAERCEIAFYQNGQFIGSSVFTMQDAVKMGLADKENWRKQPAVMLYNRAMSKGARQFCPDVFFGVAVYTEGEIEPLPPQAIPEATPDPQPQAWEMDDRRLNDLIDIATRKGYSKEDWKKYLAVKFGIEIKLKRDLKSINESQYRELILAMENDTLVDEILALQPETSASVAARELGID
jgi:hypothetical protein